MSSAVLFLITLVFSSSAQAFDISPEFQGLNEAELARMEKPGDIDAEYQTVLNAYLPRFEWERAWWTNGRSFETTVGSITNQHFLIYSRAKLDADLEDDLRFRFTYLEQSDREIDQSRHVLELTKTLKPWLRIGGYGEPSHFKRSNDAGVAVTISPMEGWDNRLYFTQHDFTRSAHNDLADRFLGEDPISFGWTSTIASATIDSRSGFRYDKPVAWNLPQEGRLFRYEKTLAFGDVEWRYAEARSAGLRVQFDSTFKGQNPVGASTLPIESWKRDRIVARLFHVSGTDDDETTTEVALTSASRGWTNQNAAKVMHESHLPSVTTRLRGARRAKGFDHTQITLEATDFHAYGDFSLVPSNQNRERFQGRAQLAHELSFSNGASLLLAGNFDLDEWVTLPTFEGGNAQFRTDF
ncbi:MAG: hypothetical protein V4760_17325 [Bdellovibrionota bacterium]